MATAHTRHARIVGSNLHSMCPLFVLTTVRVTHGVCGGSSVRAWSGSSIRRRSLDVINHERFNWGGGLSLVFSLMEATSNSADATHPSSLRCLDLKTHAACSQVSAAAAACG